MEVGVRVRIRLGSSVLNYVESGQELEIQL